MELKKIKSDLDYKTKQLIDSKERQNKLEEYLSNYDKNVKTGNLGMVITGILTVISAIFFLIWLGYGFWGIVGNIVLTYFSFCAYLFIIGIIFKSSYIKLIIPDKVSGSIDARKENSVLINRCRVLPGEIQKLNESLKNLISNPPKREEAEKGIDLKILFENVHSQ